MPEIRSAADITAAPAAPISNGSLAEGPIALAEVQGYVYGAKRAAAELARFLGHSHKADELTRQAEALRDAFEQAFWCEDLSTYALALDGKKRPCRVCAYNAGHALLTGIANRERAKRAVQTLLAKDSFSGWGIRTVASSTVRYNPMSYHNGSVWPHDTALIALELARYGLKEGVLRILTGLFDASISVELHRLPELFCGFGRLPGEGPTLYPVACSPQSWAVVSVFLPLQAALGLVIDGRRKTLSFFYPMFPTFLQEIHLSDTAVGNATVDLTSRRNEEDVSINVTKREGDVEIQIVK